MRCSHTCSSRTVVGVGAEDNAVLMSLPLSRTPPRAAGAHGAPRLYARHGALRPLGPSGTPEYERSRCVDWLLAGGPCLYTHFSSLDYSLHHYSHSCTHSRIARSITHSLTHSLARSPGTPSVLSPIWACNLRRTPPPTGAQRLPLARAVERVPDIRERAVVCRVGRPLTHRRFLNVPRAATGPPSALGEPGPGQGAAAAFRPRRPRRRLGRGDVTFPASASRPSRRAGDRRQLGGGLYNRPEAPRALDRTQSAAAVAAVRPRGQALPASPPISPLTFLKAQKKKVHLGVGRPRLLETKAPRLPVVASRLALQSRCVTEKPGRLPAQFLGFTFDPRF